jgi:hypothetical protein
MILNAGEPTNPNIIIQSTDEEDEADSRPAVKKAPRKKKKPAKSEPKDETQFPQEELDEEELGKS